MSSPILDNHLLQSLPGFQRKSFINNLEQTELTSHEPLSAAGKRLSTVYFPVGAVISALWQSGGKTMEVHGVGREGMLGSHLLFAAEYTRFDIVCQITGPILSMPASIFAEYAVDNVTLQRGA